MSLNGISSYGYSNPYAVNNAYSQASFQGATTPLYTAEETPAAEKKSSNTAKVILGVGAAAAAIGTTIYAFKKGKASNLAKGVTDASFWKNIGEGFRGIKGSIVEGFNKIFKRAKKAVPPTPAPTTPVTSTHTPSIETGISVIQDKMKHNIVIDKEDIVGRFCDEKTAQMLMDKYNTSVDYEKLKLFLAGLSSKK